MRGFWFVILYPPDFLFQGNDRSVRELRQRYDVRNGRDGPLSSSVTNRTIGNSSVANKLDRPMHLRVRRELGSVSGIYNKLELLRLSGVDRKTNIGERNSSGSLVDNGTSEIGSATSQEIAVSVIKGEEFVVSLIGVI